LFHGATTKKLTPAECAQAYATVQRLAPTVKPRDDDDHPVKRAADPKQQSHNAEACLVRAGVPRESVKLGR
jgi:hypothetical protein